MPIVIEGFDVLVLHSTLENRYPTGVAGFAADAGLSRFCTDRSLAKASFDTRNEAIAFCTYLQSRGLIATIGDVAEDFAILTKNLRFFLRCSWVMCGTYNSLPIAWSPKSRPSQIAVPTGWRRTKRETWLPPPEIEETDMKDRLQYLRKDGAHEIYLDRVTNRETRIIYVDT